VDYSPLSLHLARQVILSYYQLQRRAEERSQARTTIRMLESLVRVSQVSLVRVSQVSLVRVSQVSLVRVSQVSLVRVSQVRGRQRRTVTAVLGAGQRVCLVGVSLVISRLWMCHQSPQCCCHAIPGAVLDVFLQLLCGESKWLSCSGRLPFVMITICGVCLFIPAGACTPLCTWPCDVAGCCDCSVGSGQQYVWQQPHGMVKCVAYALPR
jgi:hypothetical protein